MRRIHALVFSNAESPNGGGWALPAAAGWIQNAKLPEVAGYERMSDGAHRFLFFTPERVKAQSHSLLTENFPKGIYGIAADDGEGEGEAPEIALYGGGHPREKADVWLQVHQLEEDEADARWKFRGMATVFGVLVDTWPLRTLIQPEAFDESLVADKDEIRVLWQHNPDEPLGKPTSLRRSGNGIEIEAVMSDTARGRDARNLVRDRVVDRLSIGFDAIRTSLTKMNGEDVRLLEKAKLYEVSLVTWGANPRARITESNKGGARQADPAKQVPEAPVAPALLALAADEHLWSAKEARQRVRAWAEKADGDLDWTKYESAFLCVDAAAPEKLTSYGGQFADVIEGELRAIPAAVFEAAASGVGHSLGVLHTLDRYYEALGRTPPWRRTPEQRSADEGWASLQREGRSAERTRWAREWLLQRGHGAGLLSGATLPVEFVTAGLQAAAREARELAKGGPTAALHAGQRIEALQRAAVALLGSELPAEARDVPSPAPGNHEAVDDRLGRAARAIGGRR